MRRRVRPFTRRHVVYSTTNLSHSIGCWARRTPSRTIGGQARVGWRGARAKHRPRGRKSAAAPSGRNNSSQTSNNWCQRSCRALTSCDASFQTPCSSIVMSNTSRKRRIRSRTCLGSALSTHTRNWPIRRIVHTVGICHEPSSPDGDWSSCSRKRLMPTR